MIKNVAGMICALAWVMIDTDAASPSECIDKLLEEIKQ